MSAITGENPCAIHGEQDIYGLGIRMSLYLQWYGGVLAFVYMREEAHIPITTNYLIAIAVGIASMVHRDDIYSLEMMIVALLLMVPPLALLMVLGDFMLFTLENYTKIRKGPKGRATLDSESESNPHNPENVTVPSHITYSCYEYGGIECLTHIAILIATIFLLGVVVWGFYYGPEVMKVAVGCHPQFANSYYLTGRYRTGLRAWSITLIIFALSTILFFMYFRWSAGRVGNKKQHGTFTYIVAEYNSISNELLPSKNKIIRPLCVIFCGAVVSAFVMTIELIIYQNGIKDVGDISTAGQLIPLTIGVASFVLMMFQRYQAVKAEEKAYAAKLENNESSNPKKDDAHIQINPMDTKTPSLEPEIKAVPAGL